MLNFIKKINTRMIDIRNEKVEVFNIEMDGIEFDSRVFEGLEKSSPNGRFAVLIERKTTRGKVLENSRCVLIDVKLKKQWIGAWNLWHKYTIEEFSEVDQNQDSKWSFKKLFNTLFNIEGVFVYKTKRMSSTFPEVRKKIFLPVASETQFTEYSAVSRTNIESLVDGRGIVFDSFKFSYFERDYQTDVNWLSVNKIKFKVMISIVVKGKENLNLCSICIFNSLRKF